MFKLNSLNSSIVRKYIKDTAIFSGLFCAGEITSKKIEKKEIEKTDIIKTASWSLMIGPFISKWYSYLDGPTFKTNRLGLFAMRYGKYNPILKATSGLLTTKAILDVAFDAPLYGSYIKYQHYNDANYPFWSKFGKMYATDLAFWIPANLVNFFYVKPAFRVPFYSSAVFVWSIVLPLISKEH